MAVLRDYPLRLWEQQVQYSDELLREFNLLLIGDGQEDEDYTAPHALVNFATTFTAMFSEELDAIYEPRRRALEAGLDRMDSEIPLVDGVEQILTEVDRLLRAADVFCDRGTLLSLPRPPVLCDLFSWTRYQLLRQAEGGAATPWPGPF